MESARQLQRSVAGRFVKFVPRAKRHFEDFPLPSFVELHQATFDQHLQHLFTSGDVAQILPRVKAPRSPTSTRPPPWTRQESRGTPPARQLRLPASAFRAIRHPIPRATSSR